MSEVAAAPAPAPAPAAPSLGTVPLGTITNIPSTPAFKRAAADLRSGKYSADPKPDAKIAEPVKTAPKVEPVKTDAASDPEPSEKTDQQQQTTTETKTTDDKGKEVKTKISPWKLVDEWKGKHSLAEKQLADLQTQLAEAKTKAPDAAETKRLTDRLDAAEARAKKAEDDLRFADYSKSDDYKTRFEKPYQDSWVAGQSLVSKMTIQKPDGETRQGTAADWDRIVESFFHNPKAASEEIAELFGSQASMVASYIVDTQRQGIRASQALEEFKTAGSERAKQQQETSQRTQTQINEQLTKTWEEANKSTLDHPEYGEFFKQREGDAEWNQRLAKGFEMADRAFKENARDPNLTPEQRKVIVSRHAAVRHRAAAFGALRYEVQRLRAEKAELQQHLDEYAGSEPDGGEGKGKNGEALAQTGGSAMDRARAALRQGKYSR